MVKLKVYFETLMKGLVENHHKVVNRFEDCDVVVVNSCGVIERTQRKVIKHVKESKAAGKKVVLAGCLPKIDPSSIEDSKPDSVIHPNSLNLINNALSDSHGFMSGSLDHSISRLDKALMRGMSGRPITPIPIAEGCLGNCTYCATRFARGKLRSFDSSSIIKASREAISHGAVELQITAQDTGIYGRDSGSNLAELLNKICRIKGGFKIRVGMMNPAHITHILPDLIKAFEDEKIYRFLHLPLQSGDDEVLSHMQRDYTSEDFKQIVKRFRRRFPDLTLSTDLIVGYPSEDHNSFSKTLGLIEDLKPDIINITRFSPRPKTKAAALKDLPDRIKKDRSRKLSALAKEVSKEINQRLIGRVEEVLITESGKNNTVLGRTNKYKQVVLRRGRVGELKKVMITDAKPHYLISR
jgi:MiaB-like tRNA modifying enzyme